MNDPPAPPTCGGPLLTLVVRHYPHLPGSSLLSDKKDQTRSQAVYFPSRSNQMSSRLPVPVAGAGAWDHTRSYFTRSSIWQDCKCVTGRCEIQGDLLRISAPHSGVYLPIRLRPERSFSKGGIRSKWSSHRQKSVRRDGAARCNSVIRCYRRMRRSPGMCSTTPRQHLGGEKRTSRQGA